ncbi:hypothetical protein C8A03DRAFT_19647 [Achaetomium macrosporum]|uniref:Uncharacterized protein n=1 Tax=Achaetomium macrosporum TaxID=79813 RepID=A0AAN7H9Q5_9PEZI|nr:hypothetical protein C8A03DRAFT_19647 [Achaetomium macrosporum]
MQYRTNYGREQRSAGPWPSARPYKGPARVPEGHFDPDELTRRLYVVLAEQRLQAERQQRARGERSGRRDGTRHRDGARPGREKQQKPAEPTADLITELRRTESAKSKPSHTALAASAPAAANQASQYRHVPSQAASQFVRTTTVDNIRNSDLIHKLSKRALKFHLEGPRTVRPPQEGGGGGETTVAPAELSRALQQTQAQRDKILDRNQFQRTRILEEAAQLDHEQQSPRKHTLEDEFLRLLRPPSRHNTRRNSTGNAADTHLSDDNRNHHHVRRSLIAMEPLMDVLAEETYDLTTTATTTTAPPRPPAPGAGAEEPHPLCRFPPSDRARVDWTQSDESRSNNNGRPKLLLSLPLLRKADSLWTLRGLGRRGSKDSSVQSPVGGGGGGGVAEGKGDEVSPTKAGKAGFFAKFKR